MLVIQMKSTLSNSPSCECEKYCAICNQFHRHCSFHEKQRHWFGRFRKFTWGELLDSARTCYCCDILLRGSQLCLLNAKLEAVDITYARLFFKSPGIPDTAEEQGMDVRISFRFPFTLLNVEIFVAAYDHEFALKFPVLTRISPRSDSELALRTIQRWLEACIQGHAERPHLCGTAKIPTLPTRIVDVGFEDGMVKLVVPQGEAPGQYACLSHCWGRKQIITTTTANIVEHMKSIPWERLSQTFKDAITLVRKLGIQYIWIDSLCIIQDDERDWQIESSKMSSIYRNCHFTVAATHARDGEGGLFHSTPDFEVSGEAPDGQSYKLYFREAMDHHIEVVHGGGDLDWGQNNFPLLSRAWVYQERMLSTRVIHFGRLGMFFECRSGIWCECSRIADDFQSGSTSRAVVKNEFAAILDSSNQSDMSGQYSCATLWRTVVSSYSVLRLTRTSDRLPAIGGLAKVMGAQRKARYLAGLWEDSLNDDLIYTIFNPLPKPYSRDAPTWSWASVNSDTAYLSELEAPALDSPNRLCPRLPYTHFSKVEQCEVLPAAVDEFGQLSHGFLTISGLVAEGHFGVRMEANIFSGKKEANYYAMFAHLRQAIYPDYLPEDIKSGTPVLCLRMSTIQHGTDEFLISLVLKESTTFPGYFERIGSMRIQSHPPPVDPVGGIYEEASLRTVTIF